jgi:ABC-type Zn uptake system ZnuABC Zn-binding protein ZnuA
LVPVGLDPHAFDPTPRDIGRIADSSLLVVNGAGLEGWIKKTLDNAGGKHTVIEASAGLKSRTPDQVDQTLGSPEVDPHFWLDPISVIHYVENIRDGLIAADPAGKDEYTRNASAYIAQLKALDGEIRSQVDQIPPKKRLIVTNHESFGYFADRYGFKIIGAIIPSVSSDASPSAQQMARLIDQIKKTGASAIFLETGTNPELADQIASDSNIKIITGLNTHSLTQPDGPAPTYLDMMRENTRLIVEALK